MKLNSLGSSTDFPSRPSILCWPSQHAAGQRQTLRVSSSGSNWPTWETLQGRKRALFPFRIHHLKKRCSISQPEIYICTKFEVKGFLWDFLEDKKTHSVSLSVASQSFESYLFHPSVKRLPKWMTSRWQIVLPTGHLWIWFVTHWTLATKHFCAPVNNLCSLDVLWWCLGNSYW